MTLLYKLYEELVMTRKKESLQDISAIFDCLSYFTRDLDHDFKILVDEFNNIKTEVPNLKKNPRIKPNYDEL